MENDKALEYFKDHVHEKQGQEKEAFEAAIRVISASADKEWSKEFKKNRGEAQ